MNNNKNTIENGAKNQEFQNYFNEILSKTKQGDELVKGQVLDCTGSWVEINDFGRIGS